MPKKTKWLHQIGCLVLFFVLSTVGAYAQKAVTGRVINKTDNSPVPGATVHLYGKGTPRPGRKMGHVTRVVPSVSK